MSDDSTSDDAKPTIVDRANAAVEAGLDADWPAQAAASVERLVGNVRDKTAGPAIKIAKVIVYGLVAAFLGLVALVLVLVVLVRLADYLIPGNVWRSHLLLGLVLTLAGMFIWRKRRPASTAT